jgi:hypothetical protein
MSDELIVRRTFHVDRERRGRKKLRSGPEVLPERVPRIARLMALAIRFDRLVSTGAVSNQAELARLGHVSRARITQIMNLALLAPDIQEQLLFLSPDNCGRARLRLSQLQPIARICNWQEQRRLWAALTGALRR